MAHNPLEQFKIKPIIEFSYAGYDFSVTNAGLFMVLVSLIVVTFFSLALRKKELVPGRMQTAAEFIYNFTVSTVTDNAGKEAFRYAPLIFSIFMFILLSNLIGLVPYAFTVTSHIAVTFALAMLVFLLITILGFIRHGTKFLSLFLPKGTPVWLAPLIILIELFAYLARPVSLSLRLAANMVAGHVLLKVIAGFAVMMVVYAKWIPIPLIVVLIGFEVFVAILQAYIFTILSCVYLNDAINLH